MNEPVVLNSHVKTNQSYRSIKEPSETAKNHILALSREIEAKYADEHIKPTDIRINKDKFKLALDESEMTKNEVCQKANISKCDFNRINKGGVNNIKTVKKVTKVLGVRITRIGVVIK
jgi:DNA-binding XRE family transcriptional regulator